jgi:hypothetical protein
MLKRNITEFKNISVSQDDSEVEDELNESCTRNIEQRPIKKIQRLHCILVSTSTFAVAQVRVVR